MKRRMEQQQVRTHQTQVATALPPHLPSPSSWKSEKASRRLPSKPLPSHILSTCGQQRQCASGSGANQQAAARPSGGRADRVGNGACTRLDTGTTASAQATELSGELTLESSPEHVNAASAWLAWQSSQAPHVSLAQVPSGLAGPRKVRLPAPQCVRAEQGNNKHALVSPSAQPACQA